MSRFEYNFTRESEFEELKDRNKELQEENQLLKQSLEELIKVNTELTESIEELNNNPNYNQNHEDIEKRFEMLFNENHNLREQLEKEQQKQEELRDATVSNDQTESLVNVLEELIESFKNIEERYEKEIQGLQQSLRENQGSWREQHSKTTQEMESKISTIEALSQQIRRKDEILESIIARVGRVEQEGRHAAAAPPIQVMPDNSTALRAMEAEVERLRAETDEKDRVLGMYGQIMSTMRSKLMEKY